MGTLRIKGTIDINQFWPNGASDADTTKIKLLVHENSFAYKDDNERSFKPTKVFSDAISKGHGSRPVIKTSTRDGSKTITVRLQGVDAPELHYKAAPLKSANDISDAERKKFNGINKERRQPFAESSTVALAKFLTPFTNASGLLPAVFESQVDKPFEVIDTYGRFIGNIKVDGNRDINVWVVENGWGHPGFYTSMTVEEINTFLDAWKKGKRKQNRPSTEISKDVNNFDWDLLYRKSPANDEFNIGDDRGKVLMPKIFRRQVSWMVAKKAGVISRTMNFNTFLKKTPDQLVLLNDFLENGVNSSLVLPLHNFVTNENKFTKSPEELVFKEKPGTLVNSRGQKIISW